MSQDLFQGAAILFDLDGTLVDTAPDLAGTMNDILIKQGLQPLPVKQVRTLVGRGARFLITHGLEARGRTASEAEIEEMFAAFLDIYAARIAQESRPYAGAELVLDLLITKGADLGIVTNKPEGLTRLLMDALDLAPRFGTFVGYETAPRPKPHPDPILLAAERLKAPLSKVVMVGDSATDVAAARAAGVPVIAMRGGYTEVPAEELGADAVVGGYSELVPAIAALLDGGQRAS